MTTDISFRDLNNSDLEFAVSANGNSRDREKNAGSQRWDYPTDPGLDSTLQPRRPRGIPASMEETLRKDR
jgi:hypothetical protein